LRSRIESPPHQRSTACRWGGASERNAAGRGEAEAAVDRRSGKHVSMGPWAASRKGLVATMRVEVERVVASCLTQMG